MVIGGRSTWNGSLALFAKVQCSNISCPMVLTYPAYGVASGEDSRIAEGAGYQEDDCQKSLLA